MLLVAGCSGLPPQADGIVSVQARIETEQVASRGDAADDPAVWVHPTDHDLSLVIATDKQSGLMVYDLDGRLRHEEPAGRTNNVDLIDGFAMPDGRSIILVAASNRTFNGVSLYRLDPESGALTDVAADRETTDLAQIYGLCAGRNAIRGEAFVYANSKDGTVYQYLASGKTGGKVGLECVRTLKLAGQVEGCTVDEQAGRLFIGEEDHGLWSFDAWPEGGDEPELIARVGDHGLAADIEGVDIAFGPADGYLVVSSQGNNSFAVFDRSPPHAWRGSFRIDDTVGIDGVEETDGLAVDARTIGAFERGLLVVQDGRNRRPQARQNFKYVAWADVVSALGLD